MILFLISFLMVFTSSYLMASVFEIKKYMTGIIYFFLIAFAQIVLTFEVLSLFNAIAKLPVLLMNAIILVLSVLLWIKKGKPLYRPRVKEFWLKIFKALKKDKMLMVISAGFLFFVAVSLFLCFLMPVTAYDSLAYHFNRALVWASQGSLAHFDIADDRNINMAINSEILFTWFLTFVQRNMFMSFFSFASYIFMVVSLYSLLEIIGFCVRKRLWVVFLVSSLAGVIMEASGVETNLMIGALALACVTLFLLGAKRSSFVPIYFSSLAAALGVGAKTTMFFMIPSLAIIFVYILRRYQKGSFWRYAGMFLGFSILNTLIFAAYNYVLNFVEFTNFMGSESSIYYHGLKGGVKGYISGLIRHFVLLIDFTGFTYGFFIEKWIFALQNKLLALLNIPLDLNVISSNDDMLNYKLNDSLAGGGVVSVLVLVPCAIIAVIKGIFCRKADKAKILALFGISLFVCIFVMSGVIGFMVYSARFLNTFLILSAPVLVISYIRSNKNLFKYLILFYVMSYFVLVSTHLWGRHFLNITRNLKEGMPLREVRTNYMCSVFLNNHGQMPFCNLRSLLYHLPKGSKIGLFSAVGDNVAVIKLMENEGYKVDFLLIEQINKYDLRSYDYLVFSKEIIESAYIKNAEEVLDNYNVTNRKLNFVDESKPPCLITQMKDKNLLIVKGATQEFTASQVVCQVPVAILEKNGFYKQMRIIYGEDASKTTDMDKLDEISIYKRY